MGGSDDEVRFHFASHVDHALEREFSANHYFENNFDRNHGLADAYEFAVHPQQGVERKRNHGITPELRASANQRRIEQLFMICNSRPLNRTQAIPKTFSLGHRRAEQHSGLTIRAFIERRRITGARGKLLNDHRALEEIAFILGVPHALNFTARFKLRTMEKTAGSRAGTKKAAPGQGSTTSLRKADSK